MNKLFIVIIIFAVLVAGGLFYWHSAQKSPTSGLKTSGQTDGESAPAEAIVIYTDSGFSPNSVTISKGGTVMWKNESSGAIRVASNPHPIHNGYPTTGGCVGSTFDSCANITPGGTWSFIFTFVGSWGYHNHLNPNQGGMVIVK